MCQFGDASKIISEQDLTREQALVGYRNWYINNSFNDKEKKLKSTNIEFLWPKGEVKGNPLRDNSEGIYNYYNYNYNYYNYNNNYYNYNYNYNYYNNYNYNYNYNNYNNNYNNYNYYNIVGKTLLYGKVFSYKEGYRSSICIPTHLTILSDKQWFENDKTKDFANHFNNLIINLAKDYDCEVIDYDDLIKERI